MSTFTLIASMKKIKAREAAKKAAEEAAKKSEKEATEEEVLKCKICGKEYKTQKGLDNHVKSKHGECDGNDAR